MYEKTKKIRMDIYFALFIKGKCKNIHIAAHSA